MWEFLILEPDTPGHDGFKSASGPRKSRSTESRPNQPASRVRGLRHLRICLQESGDTGSVVEVWTLGLEWPGAQGSDGQGEEDF